MMEIFPEEREVSVVVGGGGRKRYVRRGLIAVDEVLPHVIMPDRLRELYDAGIKDRTPEWLAVVNHDFGGHPVAMDSVRYQTFLSTGPCCARCGAEGVVFGLERDLSHKPGKYHLNLYALDADGNHVLMTKDHIVPRSRGGSEAATNMRTMCMPCNGARLNCVPTRTPALNESAAALADAAARHIIAHLLADPHGAVAERRDGVVLVACGGTAMIDPARRLVVLSGLKTPKGPAPWVCFDLMARTAGVVWRDQRQHGVLVEGADAPLAALEDLLTALREAALLPPDQPLDSADPPSGPQF